MFTVVVDSSISVWSVFGVVTHTHTQSCAVVHGVCYHDNDNVSMLICLLTWSESQEVDHW